MPRIIRVTPRGKSPSFGTYSLTGKPHSKQYVSMEQYKEAIAAGEEVIAAAAHGRADQAESIKRWKACRQLGEQK